MVGRSPAWRKQLAWDKLKIYSAYLSLFQLPLNFVSSRTGKTNRCGLLEEKGRWNVLPLFFTFVTIFLLSPSTSELLQLRCLLLRSFGKTRETQKDLLQNSHTRQANSFSSLKDFTCASVTEKAREKTGGIFFALLAGWQGGGASCLDWLSKNIYFPFFLRLWAYSLLFSSFFLIAMAFFSLSLLFLFSLRSLHSLTTCLLLLLLLLFFGSLLLSLSWVFRLLSFFSPFFLPPSIVVALSLFFDLLPSVYLVPSSSADSIFWEWVSERERE